MSILLINLVETNQMTFWDKSLGHLNYQSPYHMIIQLTVIRNLPLVKHVCYNDY